MSGVCHFKAFDSCGDFRLYGSLLALFKGLIPDTTLPGRVMVPNAELHQWSARRGFGDSLIHSYAKLILQAAADALELDSDRDKLQPLYSMLAKRQSPADEMMTQFQGGRSLAEVLRCGSTHALAAVN